MSLATFKLQPFLLQTEFDLSEVDPLSRSAVVAAGGGLEQIRVEQ
jgi:hypothetical protein